jgi:mRNA-degrading endonuclease toxin of MazEF toxin-antitoxin module
LVLKVEGYQAKQVSNDINNQFFQTFTLLPIASQPARKQYPFEVLVLKDVTGLTADSRIKANPVRTIPLDMGFKKT